MDADSNSVNDPRNETPPQAEGNGHPKAPQHWPATGVSAPAATATRREAAPKRFLAATGFMLDAARRRRGTRIALWGVVVALALGGVALLTYPLMTDVWAHRIQGGLEKQFQAAQDQGKGLTGYKERILPGHALTKLVIPKLRVNVIVVEGTTGNALRAGAGHYIDTALPGSQSGNVAIAGHRTGFGEPFRHLERLSQGDKIYLKTPFGTYAYQVLGPFDGHPNPWITGPTDWSVVAPTPTGMLTLTTCDPPHTSLNRLIVRAKLLGQTTQKV